MIRVRLVDTSGRPTSGWCELVEVVGDGAGGVVAVVVADGFLARWPLLHQRIEVENGTILELAGPDEIDRT